MIALVCVTCAVFAAWVAPHNPFDLATLELTDARLPPAWIEGGSTKYLLGTDDQGRDILSALMYGARISLLVGLASVLLSMLIGVALGLLAGFVGGRIDAFIMRVCDVMLSFPSILIALLIDGVGRAMFPERARHRWRSRVLILADRADRLGAVRAHGARLDAGRAQQGVRAGRARHRRGAAAHHVPPRAAQRAGPGAGAGDDPGRRRRSSPRRRCRFLGVGVPPTPPSLGTLIRIGNDFLFSGEWWITIFPGADAGADRAVA